MAEPYFSPSRLSLRRRMTAIGMALRESPPSLPTDRPAILYIHGLGESAICFEDLLASPRLAGWHQLAPDLLGYGKSLWTEDPLVLEGHARALGRLLDELEVGKVVLVGHSMGGVIAAHFARLLKRRTAGLLDIEGNISAADCTFSGKVADGQTLDEWLATGYPAFLAWLSERAAEAATPFEGATLRAYAASLQMADPRTVFRNSGDLVAISRRETLAVDLAALEVPSLYVYGSPRGISARSLDLLRGKKIPLQEISPAGHWPYLDQPEAFLDAMVVFLAGISP